MMMGDYRERTLCNVSIVSARDLEKSEMLRQTSHFVIFKSNRRYSITEFGSSGVKQAFVTDGHVSGDGSVLLRLSLIKPGDISIESYIDNNAGHLLLEDLEFFKPKSTPR